MNLLAGTLREGKLVVVPGKFEVALDPENLAHLRGRSGPLTLGVRSEDVELNGADGVVAQVYGVENHGVEKVVTLLVADHTIKATVPARTAVQVNGQAVMGFNQRKLQFFDPETGVSLLFAEEEGNHG